MELRIYLKPHTDFSKDCTYPSARPLPKTTGFVLMGELSWDCKISEEAKAPTHKITQKSDLLWRNNSNLKLPELEVCSLKINIPLVNSLQPLIVWRLSPGWLFCVSFVVTCKLWNMELWVRNFPKDLRNNRFETIGFVPLCTSAEKSLSIQSSHCKSPVKGWLLQINKRAQDFTKLAELSS